MSSNNISIFIRTADEHVSNMNHTLKDVKSDNFVDYIHLDY